MTGLGWKAASMGVWMPFWLTTDDIVLTFVTFAAGGLSYALWAESRR